MAGLKWSGFLGAAPRVSPELLPDTYAQTARNCKFHTGDIIPFTQPLNFQALVDRTGTVNSIFALRNPNTDAYVFQSWNVEVDIATPVSSEFAPRDQRFFYTGDGAPKVSTYTEATLSTPYPSTSFALGLPLPTTVPTLTAAVNSAKTISTIARSSAGLATIVTSTDHGFREGNVVAISGVTSISGVLGQTGYVYDFYTSTGGSPPAHGLSVGDNIQLTCEPAGIFEEVLEITAVPAAHRLSLRARTTATVSPINVCRISLTSFNDQGATVSAIYSSTSFAVSSPGFALATRSISGASVALAGTLQERTYAYTWYSGFQEESIASSPTAPTYVYEGTTVTVGGISGLPPGTHPNIIGRRIYRTVSGSVGGEANGGYFLLKTLYYPDSAVSASRTSNVSTVKMTKRHDFVVGDRFKIEAYSTFVSFAVTGGIVTEVVDEFTFRFAQVGSNFTLTTNPTPANFVIYHDAAQLPSQPARYWGSTSDGGVTYDYNFIDDFDVNLLTTGLSTDNYDPPPATLQGLTVIQNTVLAGFVDKTLYFSQPSLPHAWPNDFAISIDYKIVAIEAMGSAQALVLTEGYPYLVTGNDPATFSVSRIDSLYPCRSKASVVNMGYAIVWATNDGLAAASGGGSVELLTESIFDNDTWNVKCNPSTIKAVYNGEAYYASHSTGAFMYYRGEKGGFIVDVDATFSAGYFDAKEGRLFYVPPANQTVYEWDNPSQPPQTYEWKSKVVITKNFMNLGAARIIADFVSNITFKLFANKAEVYSNGIASSGVFRLPTGYRTDTYEISITGSSRVRSVHVADKPTNLKDV